MPILKMIRTAAIASSKLEDFVSELRALGDSIAKNGGEVVINESDGSVKFDGIMMKITGSGPYTLIIEGAFSKLGDIEYLVKKFRMYES